MFKIEKGVPVPKLERLGRPRLYPFDEMKKGDSFYVPLNGHRSLRTLQEGIHTCAKRRHCTVTTRTDKNGIRVWRVK